MHKSTTLLALLATIGVTHATVTLTISNATGVLSNLVVNGADAGTQRLMWGVLVDTNKNGFKAGEYVGGASGATNIIPNANQATNWPSPQPITVNGQTLRINDGIGGTVATDDVLYICSSFMATTGGTEGSSSGLARPLSIAGIPLSSGVDAGDYFAIVWFSYDNAGANAYGNDFSNTPFLVGDKYGLVTNADYGLTTNTLIDNAAAGAAMKLPSDGSNQPYANMFIGADPKRSAGYSFVGVIPEASTAALGLLGLLGLARRRRA